MHIFLCVIGLFIGSAAAVEKKPLRIYIDADWSSTEISSVAIERGIRTALDEVDFRLQGYPIEIVPKNHRGSSPRSRRHLESFLSDDRALALFSGQHSPPLLAHRDFINQNEILVLDPWAAAGPITRAKDEKNWIFRLSIDDMQAGRVIVDYAVDARGFKRPFLLLEDTGWGKSNQQTMGAALAKKYIQPAGTLWFNWNLSGTSARMIWRSVAETKPDVILLVANAAEGEVLIREMLDLEIQIPIASHWGITGGNFAQQIGFDRIETLDLAFIQTCFSFANKSSDPFILSVVENAKRLFPDILSAQNIAAPTGFIHAYDLTRILIAAIGQVSLTGEAKVDRRKVHFALENLQKPVRGLIKTYHTPFQSYSPKNPNAHEALNYNDFCMGCFRRNGVIHLLKDIEVAK